MNVELAVLEALFKEGLRRTMAEDEPDDIKQWARRKIDEIGGGDEASLLTWQESFDFTDKMLAEFITRAALPAEQRQVLDWPWWTWNQNIDAAEGGMLGVITAPDGMGKTIYAECISEHWAQRRNRVVYVHYELNRAWMMQRRLARHARVPVRSIRSNDLTPEQRNAIAVVRPRLLEWQGMIHYEHTPGWTMERTIAELTKLRADGMCDVVVIDYLEKVAPSPRQMKLHMEWYQREADNVEQLKNFAEATEVPVLMVAQMRKDSKSKDMSQLDRGSMRGAGEKSEKANLVVLLNRKREDIGYSNEVAVLVDKNTMGPSGATFAQWMQPEYFDVRDIAK